MQQSCSQMNQLKIKKINTKSISILQTSVGLKVMDSDSKVIQTFLFRNNTIQMDWNGFFQELNDGLEKDLSFIIEQEETKFQIFGNAEHLRNLHNFCSGKFLFKRETSHKTLEIIKERNDYQLKTIFDQYRKKRYYEHVIFPQFNNDLEVSYSSQLTYEEEKSFPQEIQIITELHILSIPQFIQVEALYFDGTQYSYTYSKKDLTRLTLYYTSNKLNDQSFIFHTAHQLVLLLAALDDKGIIHPGIDLKNLYLNLNSQNIVLASYYQAYFQSNEDDRKRCVNIGYSPPEYFTNDIKITTKANVYQAGISLFQLLLGYNPFGKTQQEMSMNHLKNNLDLTQLNACDHILSDFIKKLLQKDPKDRPSPSELLKHKLFSISQKEYLSKQTILQQCLQDIEEFQNFSQTSNIQTVKPNIQFQKRQ